MPAINVVNNENLLACSLSKWRITINDEKAIKPNIREENFQNVTIGKTYPTILKMHAFNEKDAYDNFSLTEIDSETSRACLMIVVELNTILMSAGNAPTFTSLNPTSIVEFSLQGNGTTP